MTTYTLSVLPLRLAVCRLPAEDPVPVWATAGAWWNVARTFDELSIICAAEAVPDDVPVDCDWAVLQVAGPFDFTVTGVIAQLSAPLAAAGIPILSVSTYTTDYVVVKEERLASVVQVLGQAGHIVHR
jgi:hypothetical protein